jgi:hypothetical protein
MDNINISDLTLEQKVVLRLAEMGFITSYGDIQRALKEVQYANYMISPINDDGSTGSDIDNDGNTDKPEDVIENAPGLPECDGDCEPDCNHEPLTNEEIQQVFDMDFN